MRVRWHKALDEGCAALDRDEGAALARIPAFVEQDVAGLRIDLKNNPLP